MASKRSNAENDAAKVATLTEEVHTLRVKLKDLQRGQQELTEQLVPIERLKSQMRKEKKLKEEAEHQIEVLEMEKRKLNDEVNRLLRDLVFQKGETMKFENRSLDLEKLVVQLGQSERGAQGELLRAQEREQLSRVDAFNSGIAKRSAEEERDEALARAHSKEQQLKALKAEWSVLCHHHEKLQEEVVERRVEVNALTKDQVVLRKEHVELQEKHQAQEEALQQSLAEVEALRVRSDMLETDLKTCKPPPPSETLPDMDNEQPLALVKELAADWRESMEVVDQARIFRSAMDDKELPALANYLQREISCLKSRRDYPRCAAARQMRGRILDACHGPHGPLFREP